MKCSPLYDRTNFYSPETFKQGEYDDKNGSKSVSVKAT